MNQPSPHRSLGRKPRVAVIFGGRSTEHAISCVSAGSAIAALDSDEFEVVPVGITRQGRWVLAGGDASAMAIEGRRLPEVTQESGTAVVLRADPTAHDLVALDASDGVAALSEVPRAANKTQRTPPERIAAAMVWTLRHSAVSRRSSASGCS